MLFTFRREIDNAFLWPYFLLGDISLFASDADESTAVGVRVFRILKAVQF